MAGHTRLDFESCAHAYLKTYIYILYMYVYIYIYIVYRIFLYRIFNCAFVFVGKNATA